MELVQPLPGGGPHKLLSTSASEVYTWSETSDHMLRQITFLFIKVVLLGLLKLLFVLSFVFSVSFIIKFFMCDFVRVYMYFEKLANKYITVRK